MLRLPYLLSYSIIISILFRPVIHDNLSYLLACMGMGALYGAVAALSGSGR